MNKFGPDFDQEEFDESDNGLRIKIVVQKHIYNSHGNFSFNLVYFEMTSGKYTFSTKDMGGPVHHGMFDVIKENLLRERIVKVLSPPENEEVPYSFYRLVVKAHAWLDSLR